METIKIEVSDVSLKEIIINGDRYELKKVQEELTFTDRLDSLLSKLLREVKGVLAIVLTEKDYLELHSKYYSLYYRPTQEATYRGIILISSVNANSSYIIDLEAKIWRI